MHAPETPAAPQITVRRAEREDAAAIHALVVELAVARDMVDKVHSSVADLERDGFGERPAFEALIAEVNGTAVGLCLYFASYSTWRGKPGIYVQDLVVADSARGLGVGRRLLAETAAIARARGGSYLRLSVDDDNPRAQAFYRRSGFRHSETETIQVLDENNFIALADSVEGAPL
jgi:ribosomal protein S18 acetylase RimI-like enzyme